MPKKFSPSLVGRVLFATNWGRMIETTYALVVRQTAKHVFLKILPDSKTGKSADMWLAGTTVPNLSQINDYLDLPPKELKRARIDLNPDGSLVYAVCKDHLFRLWDGNPKPYDYMD